METKVVRVSEEGVMEAVEILRRGLPVVYPTETFYGLGADPFNREAVRRVCEVKRRRENRPLSLIVKDMAMAMDLVGEFPPWAMDLARKFWPGPLTLVLKSSKSLPPYVCGRTGTVGLRVSGHPWAARLVDVFGSPLTATSANLSGAPAPVIPDDVVGQLGGTVSLVLDAGRLHGTKGSTVLDAAVFPPVLIREGEIPAIQLTKIWQKYSHLQV